MNNNEALLSLIQRGFAPVGTQAGAADLLSSSGEVIVTMKDGVEYMLRFGNPQVEAGGAPAEGEEAATDKAVNRYLFVMARFNEDALEKPELEEVPELPAETPAADSDSDEADDAADNEAPAAEASEQTDKE